MNALFQVLPHYVVPMMVWSVGLAVALLRWQRHPGVSAMATAAMLILLTTSVAGLVFYTFGTQLLFDQHDHNVAQWILRGVGLCLSLARAVAWGLALFAIFGWRTRTWLGEALGQPRDLS